MNQTSFQDFEAYTESISDADMRFTMPNLERPNWTIRERNLGPLHVQAGFEGSGNIAEGGARSDGYVLYLQRTGNWARSNGVRLSTRRVFVIAPNSEFCIASPDAHDWMSLFIPTQVLRPIRKERHQALQVSHIDSPTVGRLMYMLERVVMSSKAQSLVLDKPAAIRSVTSDLITVSRALLAEVCGRKPNPMGRPQRPREDLIASAISLIDRNAEETPTVRDLAASTNISERTLRSAFLDYFGVSPIKFMELRRLNQARTLLKDSGRQNDTVTDIAGYLGFWDFGRFAGKYCKLFGELPSATLKRCR